MIVALLVLILAAILFPGLVRNLLIVALFGVAYFIASIADRWPG
jgi:hypothetical protein